LVQQNDQELPVRRRYVVILVEKSTENYARCGPFDAK